MAAVAAAVLLRVWAAPRFANPDGGFFFYSIDAYDHLRRISLGVWNFPRLPSFDYYAAYPKGLGQIWAPLFDYVLGVICFLAGGGRAVIETICFFTPPALAALTVIAVFFVARAAFGSTLGALAAAWILGLQPGYVSGSIPMNFDHNAVEPLLILLLFFLPLRRPRQGALRWQDGVLWGTAFLIAIFTWRGSVLYWGLSFVAAFMGCFSAHDRPRARSLAVVHGALAVVLALYCLVDPFANAGGFDFKVVSWFHVALNTLWALFFLELAMIPTRRRFLAVAGIGGALLLAVAGGVMGDELKAGLSFLRGRDDPWLAVNSELHGVFSSGHGPWSSLTYLGLFWAASVPLVMVALGRLRHERGREVICLLSWSPLIVMATVIRYAYAGGVYAALATAWAVAAWSGRAKTRPAFTAAVIALVTAAGLAASFPHYQNTLELRLPAVFRYGLYGPDGALTWLREHTPPTRAYRRPVTRPEYGVLARWSMGARIYQVAARPSLATAFGWETYGFLQAAGFWSTADADAAYHLLRENRIRYVMTQAVHDVGVDARVAAKAVRSGLLAPALAPPAAGLTPDLTMQRRLALGDGAAMAAGGAFLPALSHFRLLYESPYSAGGKIPGGFYKIFEVVAGARVTGRAAPGIPVSVALPLRTARNRDFVYFDRVVSDDRGEFSLILPYATTSVNGGTMSAGSYRLRIGGRERRLRVDEKQVVQGAVIRLPEAGP